MSLKSKIQMIANLSKACNEYEQAAFELESDIKNNAQLPVPDDIWVWEDDYPNYNSPRAVVHHVLAKWAEIESILETREEFERRIGEKL